MMGKEVRRSGAGGRSGSGLRGSKTGQSFSQEARQGGGGLRVEETAVPDRWGPTPGRQGSSPRDSSLSLAPVTSPSSRTARLPPARVYI